MIRKCPYWLYDNAPLVDLANSILVNPPETTHANTDARDSLNQRHSTVGFITAQQDLGQQIFNKIWGFVVDSNLQAEWNFNITTCEPFQYTEYNSNQRYDWHIDNNFGEDDTRKLSFTLMLDPSDQGGEFQFELGSPGSPERITTINMKKGDLVVFPSYTWHRVTPILQGTRKSLVGWCRGPHFA